MRPRLHCHTRQVVRVAPFQVLLSARRVKCAVQLTKPNPPVDPWQRMLQYQSNGEILETKVVSTNKGGVIVEVGELRGFIPYSKLSPERLRRGHKGELTYLRGQTIRAKVVQVDLQGVRKEVVLSETQALQASVLAQLSAGTVVDGVVSRVEDYGAFVDVAAPGGGRAQGLVHKSQVSWDVVVNVSAVLTPGQQVRAVVLESDPARGRLSLSMRALLPDPLKENLDTLTWHESGAPLPEVVDIITALRQEPCVVDVQLGRQAEEARSVAQDVELYLTKESVPGVYRVVARVGRVLQELDVTSGCSKDALKTMLSSVLRSNVQPSTSSEDE